MKNSFLEFSGAAGRLVADGWRRLKTPGARVRDCNARQGFLPMEGFRSPPNMPPTPTGGPEDPGESRGVAMLCGQSSIPLWPAMSPGLVLFFGALVALPVAFFVLGKAMTS